MATIDDIKIAELLELISNNLDLSSIVTFYSTINMTLPDKYIKYIINAINGLKSMKYFYRNHICYSEIENRKNNDYYYCCSCYKTVDDCCDMYCCVDCDEYICVECNKLGKFIKFKKKCNSCNYILCNKVECYNYETKYNHLHNNNTVCKDCYYKYE